SACVHAITDTITADAGLPPAKAQLLASGLVGMSQVSARYWQDNHSAVDRDEAIALIAQLAWRGIGGGFPLKQSYTAGTAVRISDVSRRATSVVRSCMSMWPAPGYST